MAQGPRHHDYDVVLVDPTCDQIQRAINPFLDDQTQGSKVDWSVSITGALNGDGLMEESDVSGRNVSGNADYNVCFVLCGTTNYTSNFPDCDGGFRLGDESIRSHIYFEDFVVEMSNEDTAQTKPMIFMQIGNLYNYGWASATSTNPHNGAWVTYLTVSGKLQIRVDTDSSYQTWPIGRPPRFPIDAVGGDFPAQAMIGIFSNAVQHSDFGDLHYTFRGDRALGGGKPSQTGTFGFIHYIGWFNIYPRFHISFANIGVWFMGNSIGSVHGGIVRTNGISVLFGSHYGGGQSVWGGCTSGNCGNNSVETAGLSFFGLFTDGDSVSDVVMMGAKNIWMRGLRHENSSAGGGRPTKDTGRLGDFISIGAGYCSGGTDPYRNTLTGNSVTDLVCTSDEQCNSPIDGTGGNTCVITDFTDSTPESNAIYLEIQSMSKQAQTTNRYGSIAFGPSALSTSLGGEVETGPHVVIRGALAFSDQDRSAPGNWETDFLVGSLGGAGFCTAVDLTDCWVGDLSSAQTVGTLCAGDGSVEHGSDAQWAVCRYDSGDAQWEFRGDSGDDISCADVENERDCAPFYYNSAATVVVDVNDAIYDAAAFSDGSADDAQLGTLCQHFTDFAAADNQGFAAWDHRVVVSQAWCWCDGTCTTNAQLTFDGMTGTVICDDLTSAVDTPTDLTSGELSAFAPLIFDTPTDPDPTTDEYTICVRGKEIR